MSRLTLTDCLVNLEKLSQDWLKWRGMKIEVSHVITLIYNDIC